MKICWLYQIFVAVCTVCTTISLLISHTSHHFPSVLHHLPPVLRCFEASGADPGACPASCTFRRNSLPNGTIRRFIDSVRIKGGGRLRHVTTVNRLCAHRRLCRLEAIHFFRPKACPTRPEVSTLTSLCPLFGLQSVSTHQEKRPGGLRENIECRQTGIWKTIGTFDTFDCSFDFRNISCERGSTFWNWANIFAFPAGSLQGAFTSYILWH